MIDGAALTRLLYWVRERERVRVLKEEDRAPFPWTDDPIIRDYRFCNVRREDDRVTRWIDANVRRPFATHPLLWLMLCAARVINWPDTLEELIDRRDLSLLESWPDREAFAPADMEHALLMRAGRSDKVFTGAYIIPTGNGTCDTKARYVAIVMLGRLWADRDRIGKLFPVVGPRSMRAVHRGLMSYDGWGPFLAYQAVVDMRFTPLLRDAADVCTWAAAGPGTTRGLNRLHGRKVDDPRHQDQLLHEILELWPVVEGETGVGLDLSDVPNVLCEFDKYERVRLGEGAPRARYVPGRGS